MNSENKDTNHDNRSKDSTIQAQTNDMTKAACRNKTEQVRRADQALCPTPSGSFVGRGP